MDFLASPLFFSLIGFILGSLTTWLLLRACSSLAHAAGRAAGAVECRILTQQLNREVARWREANGRLTAEVAARHRRFVELQDTHRRLTEERDSLLHAQDELKIRLVELDATLDRERDRTQEKLDALNEARDKLSDQFRSLADEFLKESLGPRSTRGSQSQR